MLRFTRHRPRIDKLLNTEHEAHPSNRSGASEAHIHPYIYILIHTYMHTDDISNLLIRIRRGRGLRCKYVKISR
jgi:hypothetical protein